MKSLQSIVYIAVAGLLISGCKREDVASLIDSQSPAGLANVKIIYASAYTVNSSVHLRLNGVRVSNNITNTTPFPGGGLNTGGASSPWYLGVTPGITTVTLAIPNAGTGVDSVTLYNGSSYFAADRYYSAFLTDTAAKTQMVILNDDPTLPANGFSRFRFVNLMPNQISMDLYAGTTKVASDIVYKTTSPDFLLPKGDTVRWSVRPAGAAPTSTPIAFYPAYTLGPYTVLDQRVLTVFSRGYNGGTGNKVPNVSLLYTH